MVVIMTLCLPAVVPSVTHRLPDRSSAAYAEGLRRNFADHESEIEKSVELGFRRASAAAAVVPPTTAHCIASSSLGMGRNCPFEGDRLVHACSEPLFTADECIAVRTEAAAMMADGKQSSFTMTDTNRDVSVHDLPRTLSWLNSGAFARVATLAAQCFPSAVPDPSSLYIYRGLVIHYEAAAGLTHQPIHRDGALVSCVVPLSERSEYDGGGTYIEPLGEALALERGCALLHPSAVRHSGHRIRSGERWVLVLFMNCVVMHPGEHGRRFRARAQEWYAAEQTAQEAMAAALEVEAAGDHENGHEPGAEAEEAEEAEEAVDNDEDDDDDDDEELQNLLLALRATDEQDHELWYDLGARAHDRGETAEALTLYDRADALNPHDALLLSNKGVALLEMGQPRDAIRCYRRALAADAHSVNARFNLGELLLETGRLRALAALLADAPADVVEDDGVAGLVMELDVAQNKQHDAAAAAAAAPPPGQRGWVPRVREVEGTSAAGYTWRETETEIEVCVPLPCGTVARDLTVSIGATTLRVSVAGDERLGGVLNGALLAADSSWCLESDDEDEAPVLQLDLLKKERTAAGAPLWGSLFAGEAGVE